MSTNVKNVAGTVRELILPVANELGYQLWDVEYVKEGAKMILRVTIDKAEGVNIEDCERMHRAIDPVLDEADPIDAAYYLEVSSPGIERELRTDEHLLACMGEKVEARLYAPVDGTKKLVGILAAYEDGEIAIAMGERVQRLPRTAVSKIKTVFDFGD
ncbi:MAG: ribosome maturation factor RimP [Ruminococcaceae bacterium]|nr:ribosome maturation factor RimP [Oscillospiraceae bacterium]